MPGKRKLSQFESELPLKEFDVHQESIMDFVSIMLNQVENVVSGAVTSSDITSSLTTTPHGPSGEIQLPTTETPS